MHMPLRKAIFFDRDGTLIEDVHYLSSFSSIRLMYSIVEFAALAQQAGFLLICVTNQSGIARGMFTEQFVQETHKQLDVLLQKHQVAIAAWYYCPHHSTAAVDARYKVVCKCRKPAPGMLLQAADDWHIDLTQSLMVGDTESDLDAGKAAGCNTFAVHDIIALSLSEKIKLLDVLSTEYAFVQTKGHMLKKETKK